MIPEAQDLLTTLERLTEQLLEAVEAGGQPALDWHPEAPETNSPAAIVTHALGASRHWLVAVVGGESDDRDRQAEFRAAARDVADIRERGRLWLADARRVLERLSTADLDAPCRQPVTTQPWMASLSARGAILHVIEHIGMHIGHMELTVQLWKAQRVGA